MSKRIAINATLLTPKSGGIGEYMIQLMDHLLVMDKQNEYIIFISEKYKSYLQKFLPTADLYAIDLPVENQIRRTLKEPFVWPQVLKRTKPDIFHSLVSYIPLGVNIPSIVTVHDLRYWHFPETYPRLRGLYLSKMIPRSVRKAQHVIAISEFTKDDLIERFGTNPDKITTVHQGLDLHKFQKRSEILMADCQKKYNLPNKYILSLGHLEPRKNYIRLLQAFKILVEKGFEHHLVIAGKEYYDFKKIYQTVDLLNLQDRVHITGFVAEEHLPPLYQQAELFVAPSIFEGFGFTPLEAIAAGTPVAAAAATSFPEVLGKAALYFDPYDPQDIAEKMQIGLTEQNAQSALLNRGVEQIRKYHWQQCAQQTLDLYSKILEV